MSVVVVTPPEPGIDLALVKGHLRVDHEEDDQLIQAYVDAAVSHIDGPSGWLSRTIWPQTLELRQNVFCGPIRLPYGPVTDVVSVKYVDGDGVEQTMPPADYMLTNDGVLTLAFGASWPALRGDAEGVRVQYEAGYEVLPPSILPAVMLTVSHWYANREAVSVGQAATEMPMSAQALLSPFRAWSV